MVLTIYVKCRGISHDLLWCGVAPGYLLNFFRPLSMRLFRTRRPALVAIRFMKPCSRLTVRFFGWWVLFGILTSFRRPNFRRALLRWPPYCSRSPYIKYASFDQLDGRLALHHRKFELMQCNLGVF